MRGGDLPQAEFRIQHEAAPKRESAPPEVAAMHMAKLAELLGEPSEPNEAEKASA